MGETNNKSLLKRLFCSIISHDYISMGLPYKVYENDDVTIYNRDYRCMRCGKTTIKIWPSHNEII